MQRSARSCRPDVRNMARLLQAIITYSTLTLCVQGDHHTTQERNVFLASRLDKIVGIRYHTGIAGLEKLQSLPSPMYYV
jgi:hypothetical protein